MDGAVEEAMKRHQGGSAVASGFYLDTRGLTVVNLPAGGRLPGQTGRSFVRVPWPALLLLAPWIGGAFILVGPAIGLAAAAWGLARRAAGAAATGARGLAAAAAPRGAAGEAHLTGPPRPGRAAPGARRDELERRIARRRREGGRPPDS
jgi:hypothetical protein